jgi:hypothetical protein
MFLVGIFQWWYGAGWRRHARLSGLGILRTADFFSVGLLARTLFNPFRQISAGRVDGPLPVQLSAFFDRLFSRVIGGIIRTGTIFIGLFVILLRSVWTLVSIVLWTLLPLFPVVGVVLWLGGVTL